MKNQNEKIVVAQIVGKMVGGGVESFIMNYYRNIDKNKIQFDFIVDEDSTYIPEEEILQLGGRVIKITPYQNIVKYIIDLTKLLKHNKYKIVHSHLNVLNVFPLLCAKLANVPVRISHSHSTTNKIERKKNFIKNILKPLSKIFATDYFSCSEHAGRWLFGDKSFDEGKVTIIHNAIDLNKFKFDEEIRHKIRKQLNIEDKFVIGHVGRFIKQKNHDFLIDVFNKFHKKNPNAILLLIGEGVLIENIKEKVEKINLKDKVIFLGIKDNVNEYMQAMDAFVFPSLYEGLGIVLIEAQCSGLPCIVSRDVPKEVKLTDNVKFLEISEKLEIWEKNIKYNNNRKINLNIIKENGYDIKTESKKLLQIYEDKINSIQ